MDLWNLLFYGKIIDTGELLCHGMDFWCIFEGKDNQRFMNVSKVTSGKMKMQSGF